MGELARFRVVFEEEASEFIISQSGRKRRKLADIAYSIAESPFAEPDYVLPDADGRLIAHVATEGYVISYWVDAPVSQKMTRFLIALCMFAVVGCAKVADLTAGVSDVCPVHHLKMEKRRVQSVDGRRLIEQVQTDFEFAGGSKGFAKIESSRFPFARTAVGHGDEGDQRYEALLYVCSRCVEEKAKWRKEKEANQPPEPTSGLRPAAAHL